MTDFLVELLLLELFEVLLLGVICCTCLLPVCFILTFSCKYFTYKSPHLSINPVQLIIQFWAYILVIMESLYYGIYLTKQNMTELYLIWGDYENKNWPTGRIGRKILLPSPSPQTCPHQRHSHFTASFCAYFPSAQEGAWEESGTTQFDSGFCVVLCHYCIWRQKIQSLLGVPASVMMGYMGEVNCLLEWSIHNRPKCSITTKSSRVWHNFLIRSGIQHCPGWHRLADNSNQPVQKVQSHPQRDFLNWVCLGVSAVTSIYLHRSGCPCSSGKRVLWAVLCSE